MTPAPVFACGYKVSQDYLRPFFTTDSEEVTPILLSARVNIWYKFLSPEDRAGCPAIIKYLPSAEHTYASAVYFVRTRLVAITSLQQIDTELTETEEDKKKKKRFLEVFGRGFDEQELHFEIKEWKTI